MTRDDVVQLINWRLGNKQMEARILAEMRFVQQTILEAKEWLPWFLETELASASTLAGERRVQLPSDFLQEIEDEALYITAEDGEVFKLVKRDSDTIGLNKPETGRPEYYALNNKYFLFYPVPDAAYTISFRYMARDTDMSADNVETAWLEHASDVVIGEVGAVVAGQHLQNPALAQTFKAAAQEGWTRLYTKHVAMAELNCSRTMEG